MTGRKSPLHSTGSPTTGLAQGAIFAPSILALAIRPKIKTDSEFPEGRELSKWARRWWGAFAEPGCSSPEDPAWEKQIIAEESGEKHA